MSSADAFQQLVEETLLANAAVVALVNNRVYETAPPKAARVYPDVTFGPADTNDEDADCIDGVEHILQLDVWARDFGRLSLAKRIADAIRKALHRADLALPDPYALALIEVASIRAFQDPDGLTAHAVISVRSIIETET